MKKERQRRKVGEAAPELMQEGAKVKTFLIKLEQIYFMSLYALTTLCTTINHTGLLNIATIIGVILRE